MMHVVAPDCLTSAAAGLSFAHTTICTTVLGAAHMLGIVLLLLAGVSLINSIGLHWNIIDSNKKKIFFFCFKIYPYITEKLIMRFLQNFSIILYNLLTGLHS